MIDDDMPYAVEHGKTRAVFAQSDYKLIKDALLFYAHNYGSITENEASAISNLVHRLGRVDK